MPRVLSCIQPTGVVHLGNYLGALRNWVIGQHECDAFHGIVDLHALTVTEEPHVLGRQTMSLAAMFFAIGLDPDVLANVSSETTLDLPCGRFYLASVSATAPITLRVSMPSLMIFNATVRRTGSSCPAM